MKIQYEVLNELTGNKRLPKAIFNTLPEAKKFRKDWIKKHPYVLSDFIFIYKSWKEKDSRKYCRIYGEACN